MDFIHMLQKHAFEPSLDMEKYKYDLSGWKDSTFDIIFREQIISIYNSVKRPLVIIEVGTWKGLSAITMAQIAKDLNIPIVVVCVDTWLGAPEFWTWGLNDPSRGISLQKINGYPTVYYTFIKNVIQTQCEKYIAPFPISSNEAVDIFSFYSIKADLIYVDASHEYEAVKNDITRYTTLLGPEGCIFGDDYCTNWPGVQRAVDECVPEKKVSGVVWYYKKM